MNPDPILPIVLTVTVYPPKKNKRRVVVSGAPEGEMPLLLTGLFQERHALLDQAYAECLKRKPQLVTIEEKKTTKRKSDQLVGSTETITETLKDDEGTEEELPAIEGDEGSRGDATAVQVIEVTGSTEAGEIPRFARNDTDNDTDAVEVGDGE